LLKHKGKYVHILTVETAPGQCHSTSCRSDPAKIAREGFGLTATEAMWKATAVIAGNCGGLKHQIEDGVTAIWCRRSTKPRRRLVRC